MAKAKKDPAGKAVTKPAAHTKKAAEPKKEQTTKAKATTKAPARADAGDAATKKKAPAKPAAGQPSAAGVPLIDTSLAAAAAANMVMNRAMLGNAGASEAAPSHEPAGEKRESSAFKQLKQNLNKPSLGGTGGILGQPPGGKKGNLPFGGGHRQVGRNQTFGADATRSGVPRRTSGG